MKRKIWATFLVIFVFSMITFVFFGCGEKNPYPNRQHITMLIVDAVVASLNLTENMNLALDYRMSGMSYPDIAKMLSRATSTVYEYFIKMRQRYLSTYSGYIYPRCH